MTGLAEIRHARILMHQSADTVSNEISDDPISVGFNVILDRGRQITELCAVLNLLYSLKEAFPCHIYKPLRLFTDLSDRECSRSVAVPAVKYAAHVYTYDVPVFEHLVL